MVVVAGWPVTRGERSVLALGDLRDHLVLSILTIVYGSLALVVRNFDLTMLHAVVIWLSEDSTSAFPLIQTS